MSVIIPAWRAAAFVGRAIASAQAQSLQDLQIIVVNDCSPDDTDGAVRRAAAGDARVELITHDCNRGPAAARNTALAAARGDWIALLDADDTIAPARLDTLVRRGEEEKADIIADDLLIINESLPRAAPVRHLNNRLVETIDLAGFARNNEMFNRARHKGYLKPLFRRAFLARHGLTYDPDVRIGEDYMFVATALALNARYRLRPEALYHYHVRGDSMSRRLGACDLAMLIAADERFQARFTAGFDARTRRAVQGRRRSLETAAAFVAAVDALKQRRFGQALDSIARRPASLRHFAMPIGARLARLAAPGRAP